jgi:molybdopterin adenylyltransferase
MSDQPAKIGILTVSDRASRGEYEDRGGPAIRDYLAEVLSSEFETVPIIIRDEQSAIEQSLRELCDHHRCWLIITTGGTGPADRDVTPEATEAVCKRLLPGFGELMRVVSLEKVATAILSRQTAGIRWSEQDDSQRSLIINLPGQPKAISECLDAVFAAVPFCIDLRGGPFITTNDSRFVTFRPKNK